MVAPKHKEIDYRNIVSIQRRLTPTKKLYQRLLSESSEIWMNSAIKSDVGVCGWQKVHDLWLPAENRLRESKRNTVALDSCNHQLIHATFFRINSKWRRSQNEFPSSSLFSFYFSFENVHRRIRNAICCDVVRMFRYLIVFTHSLCAGLFVRLSVGSAAAAPTVLLLYKHTNSVHIYQWCDYEWWNWIFQECVCRFVWCNEMCFYYSFISKKNTPTIYAFAYI